MMRFPFPYIILLYLFCASQATAQQSSYISYDTKDGLAQSQVRAIAQDKKGYMWFGTLGGLSRFDGYEFKNFSTQDGLPANQINCLLQGEEYFWIGSTGSISRLDGTVFSDIPLPSDFVGSRIFDMAEDSTGALWIALAGEGLLKYFEGKFTHFGVDQGIEDPYLRCLSFDSEGNLWIGSRTGVYIIRGEELVQAPFEELRTTSVSDILFTKSGTGVICTFGNGLYFVSGTEIKNATTGHGILSNHIRQAIELHNGELRFGSREGMASLSNGVFRSYREAQGLQYSNVKSLALDREGNLWVGTDGQGILLQAGRSFTSYGTSDGLHSELVLDICRTDTGSLLVGSYDNGLATFYNGSFKPYVYNDFLPSNTVWALECSEEGVIWAGTSQGLLRESRGNITVISGANGLPGDRVTALEIDAGTVWIGTESGLARVSEFGDLLNVYNQESGFEGKRIRSILKSGRELWIGAEGRLYKFLDGEFSYIPMDEKEENPIYCLEVDAVGMVWVGTSNGLFRIDKRSMAQEIHFSDNFSSRNVNFLSLLSDSTMLVGTNNGVYRLKVEKDGRRVKRKHYTDYEGLKSTETNQNAVHYDGKNSNVWFGTTSGMVEFNPYRDVFNKSVAPAVTIKDVQLYLQNVDWSKMADSTSAYSGLPVNPILKHDKNYLTFNYTGIYFSNPEKVRYRYKLEGADDTWLGPTKSRTVTYAYLPPGEYNFVLEAYSEDDPGKVNSANFSFVITPPFYLRPWFFIIVTLFFMGVIYTLYLSRIRKEEEKRQTLQLQFQSRLMELESQTLNSSMNRHFIFNALNSIQYYINMQDRKSANRYLTSFAKLIRKNLDSSQQNETSLQDELERLELYLSLEQMRFQGRFVYEINIADTVNTELVQIPAMMLQPFLENSIWHGILPTSAPGIVKVDVRNVGDEVIVEITDNGIGINTSLNSKPVESNGHVSKGMEITRNRIQLYRKITGLNYLVEGPEEIIDKEGKTLGTAVRVRLPITQELDHREKFAEIV